MAIAGPQKTARVHFGLGLTAVFAIAFEGMLTFQTLKQANYDIATIHWGRQLLINDAIILVPAAILVFTASWCVYTWTHPIRGKVARTVALMLLIPCLTLVLPGLIGGLFIGPHLFPEAIAFTVKNFGMVCFAATAAWSIYFAASRTTLPDPLDWVDKRRKT